MFKAVLFGLMGSVAMGKKFERIASSVNGHYVLDKACFGYSEGPDSHTGELNLRLVARSNPPPVNMHVLLFDDEPSSFAAGMDDAVPCNRRSSYAKNFADVGELHAVRWVSGEWVLPPITITNSFKPRVWYLVLNSCTNTTFEVIYDSDLSGSGVYHRGQGPTSENCAVDSGFDENGANTHYNDLVGFMIAFFFICLILLVTLIYQCRRTKFLQTAPVSVKPNEEHETGKWNDDVAAADELEEEADV